MSSRRDPHNAARLRNEDVAACMLRGIDSGRNGSPTSTEVQSSIGTHPHRSVAQPMRDQEGHTHQRAIERAIGTGS